MDSINLSAIEINQVIDGFNAEIYQVEKYKYRDYALPSVPSYDSYFDVEIKSAKKIKNINSISSYYGGIKQKIDSKINATFIFEGFSVKRSGELNYNLVDGPSEESYRSRQIDTDLNIDLSLNSIVAMLSYDVSDHYSLSTGGGYYLGSLNWSEKVKATISIYDNGELQAKNTSLEYDLTENASLGGFGLKIGSSFHYPLGNGLAFVLTDNYRWLHLETDKKTEEDSSYSGSLSEYSSFNASGIEVKIGVSFGFPSLR